MPGGEGVGATWFGRSVIVLEPTTSAVADGASEISVFEIGRAGPPGISVREPNMYREAASGV
jgi:hypothetical protein